MMPPHFYLPSNNPGNELTLTQLLSEKHEGLKRILVAGSDKNMHQFVQTYARESMFNFDAEKTKIYLLAGH